MKRRFRIRMCAVVLLLLLTPVASAFGYSTIVAFGDSLSDNGNVAKLTDGRLWVELLAGHYGAELLDFAYAGATTGVDNPWLGSPVSGLLWQVDTFGHTLGAMPADDTLISVWAGANDLIQQRSPVDAVANIRTALESLYGAGGREFVVPNLPDIGKTPAFLLGNPQASPLASAWSLAHNGLLADMVQDFGALHDDAELFYVDIFSIFNQYAPGSEAWAGLFWDDGFHPSAAGHQCIYQGTLAAIDAVPEPASMLLFGAGFTGFALCRRRAAH